jgi:hypothetical protein
MNAASDDFVAIGGTRILLGFPLTYPAMLATAADKSRGLKIHGMDGLATLETRTLAPRQKGELNTLAKD